MISSKSANTTNTIINWAIGHSPDVLDEILNDHVNIVIHERNVDALDEQVALLLDQNISFRSSGKIDDITEDLMAMVNHQNCTTLLQDIKVQLEKFASISKADEFRLMLATIDNNMCRKFHTDINDLRLLCTYAGPGTLWLSNDNINMKALNAYGDNTSIVLDEENVQQAKTGSVVILKGAIFPGESTQAVVHRSPTIEESRTKRLLLRIDTNATMKLWT